MKLTTKVTCLFMAVASLLLTQSCDRSNTTERPREHWVFRSVLDEHPRVLTAALHDDLWVAYDTQDATLFKAWEGDVNFSGAVYDEAHGPQPTTRGTQFFENTRDQWLLQDEQGTYLPEIRYQGHQFRDGRLYLATLLISPDQDTIRLEESPEFDAESGTAGLERKFSLKHNSNYKIFLASDALDDANALSLRGQANLSENPQSIDGVDLPPNRILIEDGTSLHFAIETSKGVATGATEKAAPSKEGMAGKALAGASDCRACHNELVKTVGPSYLAIAKRYHDNEENKELLAEKIISGGNGSWGQAMMTPHENISREEAYQIAEYILAVDDTLDTGASKFTLDRESVKFSDAPEANGRGFLARIYANPEDKDPLEFLDNQNPDLSRTVQAVHINGKGDFEVASDNFAIVYEGILEIPEDGSYGFRLISDDGSYLYIDGKEVIDNGGSHGSVIKDGEMYLTAGDHPIQLAYNQGEGGAMVSLQLFDTEMEAYTLVDEAMVYHEGSSQLATKGQAEQLSLPETSEILALKGVHPSFDLKQARPDDFKPKVGGIDFLEDGRMVVSTWDPDGAVYAIENWDSGDPADMKVSKIAFGLAEPLGLKVVDGDIYVLQKQELTRLRDRDGDGIMDDYHTVSNQWKVSANFHEFAFGLVYKDGYFYATLATAIQPGGASTKPQIEDRGKAIRIDPTTGAVEFVASGLRTPNGIGLGLNDEEIFIADNQGDWLPSSKVVHLQQDAFYGSRSVTPERVKDREETPPVVWMPQDEIGNSPSTPLGINIGPYEDQLLVGEVTHGGIKRIFVEEVNGQLQGALFRFTQGMEAGVNRLAWAPDGSLIVGGVGSSGNWNHYGAYWYGLQRLVYNEKSTFEILTISVQPDGFRIVLTEPLADSVEIGPEDLQIQQWRYEPTENYGGPKLDLQTLQASNISLHKDRKTLEVTLPQIKAGHVVYFKLSDQFKNKEGEGLWNRESWYTLNQIPSK